MSVAVTLSVSDGLVIGVDSAVTVSYGPGKTNIYEDGEKLFRLGTKRIGVATFGIAGIGTRSIGSFVREFEFKDVNGVMTTDCPLSDIVEAMRGFFYEAYLAIIVPAVEALEKMPFAQVPIEKRPSLGLLIGGYSEGQFLPEIWQVSIPESSTKNSSQLLRGPGVPGLSWHATNLPIHRYIKGLDPYMLNEMDAVIVKIIGRPLDAAELQEFRDIFSRHEYKFVYDSMPISSAIRFVRSLINLVIEHYRVVAEDSVVGGEVRIGIVTYKGDTFQIIK